MAILRDQHTPAFSHAPIKNDGGGPSVWSLWSENEGVKQLLISKSVPKVAVYFMDQIENI